MGWIKERILKEYAKHGDRLDWARLAEGKILLEISEIINDWNKSISTNGLACDKTLCRLKTMISKQEKNGK